jgi:hypothetical protein
MTDTTYVDQWYKDTSGQLHWLSADDHKRAASADWRGPTLPNELWTSISDDDAAAISNPTPTLADLKDARIKYLRDMYQSTITAPVSFTTVGGVTADFPHDTTVVSCMTTYVSAGTDKWTLNFWLDVHGNAVSPFIYSDLEGLYKKITDLSGSTTLWYQTLLGLIAEVHAAPTADAVNAIVWTVS